MKDLIDMHVHSNCSDGTCTPTKLVELAKRIPLRAFALTDHDTTAGIREAVEAAKGTGVEVIPGIEFSTSYGGKDVHVLGLGIDYENAYFQEKLEEFRDSRGLRNDKMIARLQEVGISITREQMEERYPDAVWTRAHFGAYLYEEGYVSSVNEAFVRYIGDRAPCFVPREKVTPVHAIRLIHQAGGYAVLAHPLLYGFSRERLENLVEELTGAGLDGLEAIYSSNRMSDECSMRQLAARHGLKVTGGSDFHGENKPDLQLGFGKGNLRIPYALWEVLRGKEA